MHSNLTCSHCFYYIDVIETQFSVFSDCMLHATLMDNDSFILKLLNSKNWKIKFQDVRSHQLLSENDLTEYVLQNFDIKFFKKI